ncbi:conserved hypothetical protein [Bacteroides fragilis 638R]|uniref:Uncharacterized protein n=1 Tax=Bacteroides fragilis (strain 638R) TaxID=862962 RepID=E1WW41_BACF6|nr:conserved hypothetical protein [Bacteroides fragilis 638R]
MLFLVVHIYVFYVVNSTGWNCRRQLPLPQFATSEQIAAPCKGKRFFAAKRSGAAKNTACYVRANINLSSLERKERFRGKRGLATDGGQTIHFPVGWRKVRK